MSSELRQKALRLYKSTFGSSPCLTAYAPGAITLLGNCRDKVDGNAVSVATEMGVVVAGTIVPGNVCRVISDRTETMEEFKGDSSLAPRSQDSWIDLVSGVVREFITRFDKEEIGFDVAIVSDIPLERGMGLLSSVGDAMSLFLEHALMVVQSPEERSSLCVSAERQFIPSSVDSVGAFTSSCSQNGSLLFVNSHANEGEWMPLVSSMCLLVCKCGGSKGVVGDSCSDGGVVAPVDGVVASVDRVDAPVDGVDAPVDGVDAPTIADAAPTNNTNPATTLLTTLQAKYPQLASLSDATPDQVETVKKELGDAYPLAYHLVSEEQRVQSCKEAMEAKDYDRVGSLLMESHASLRDNTNATSPEVDSLVEIAIEQSGVLGARFTSDDCVVCLVESSQAKSVMWAIEADYKERTGISCSVFICSPSQGAHLLQEEVAVEKSLWKRPLFWVGVAGVAAAATMVVLRSRRSCSVCLESRIVMHEWFFILKSHDGFGTHIHLQ